MRTSSIKAQLERGESVVGSFVYVPSSRLAEIIGLCGFDFIVIDQEHGPIGSSTAEEMIRACELTGCTPLVRVPQLESHYILQALDLGAMGVHIPTVNTPEDARSAVSFCKYAPCGSRGLAAVRAADYGLGQALSDYCEQANKEILVVAHIEHTEAVENLDALLAIEGIDVYYVGPTDLSSSLGRPGKTDAAVQKIVDQAIAAIVRAGKVAGVITTDAAAAQRYVDMGVRYLATHAMSFLVSASKSFLKAVKRQDSEG